ncbi:hypothetical protein Kpol_2001p75 [Vanderwaltozyma polyspora DSM 70294]|uniref:Nucleoprotein TPR/MLP1 domain-containing protein n=1 Tax=Vanderwaltozyma polyspora (strain ATCC 22028 / DSM 70294 / BCRC 21397 / CBS 2163 / NBRC 10782 / NRRL Y-8283 / UCD 57-17) TaxID=436907 RepID=A7TGV4_VANPO|nr:uncharacterized protein Kpol_2001p75 [Vanderwaltozyma polyspora DSM 70294]EDO18567.1 hypothetical protein Kpol_2001p75 [Vanderwaltozyma polyspora DSM 70294]
MSKNEISFSSISLEKENNSLKREIKRLSDKYNLLENNYKWLNERLVRDQKNYLIDTHDVKYSSKNDNKLYNSHNKLLELQKEFLISHNEKLSDRLNENSIEFNDKFNSVVIDNLNNEKNLILFEKKLNLLNERYSIIIKDQKDVIDNDINNSKYLEFKSLNEKIIKQNSNMKSMESKIEKLNAIIHNFIDINEFDNENTNKYSLDLNDNKVLKKLLVHEKNSNLKLQEELNSILLELNFKLPSLTSLKEKNHELQSVFENIISSNEELLQQFHSNTDKIASMNNKIVDYEQSLKQLLSQRTNLISYILNLLNVINLNSKYLNLSESEGCLIQNLFNNERIQRFLQEKNLTLTEIFDNLNTVDITFNNFNRSDIKVLPPTESASKEEIINYKNEIILLENNCDAYKMILYNNGITEDLDEKLKIESSSRMTELNEKNSRIQMLESKIDELNSIVTKLNEKNSRFMASINKNNSSESTILEKYNLLNQSYKTLLEAYKSLKSNATDNKKAVLTSTLDDTKKIVEFKSTINYLNSTIKSLSAKLVSIQESNDLLADENQKIKMENSNLSSLLNKINTDKNSISNELSDLHSKEILELETEKTKLLEQLEEGERKLKETNEKHNEQIKWFQNKIDNFNEETTKNQFNNALKNDYENLKKSFEEKSKEVEEANDKFSRLKRQANERLNASKTTQKELSDNVKSLEDERTNFKEHISKLEVDINNLNNALVEAEKKLSEENLKYETERQTGSTLRLKIDDLQLNEDNLKEKVKNLEENESTLKDKIKMIEGNEDDLMGKISVLQSNEILLKDKLNDLNSKSSNNSELVDVEGLKKDWEKEYSHIIEKRIEYAEMQLEKRLKSEMEREMDDKMKVVEMKGFESGKASSEKTLNLLEHKLSLLEKQNNEKSNKINTLIESENNNKTQKINPFTFSSVEPKISNLVSNDTIIEFSKAPAVSNNEGKETITESNSQIEGESSHQIPTKSVEAIDSQLKRNTDEESNSIDVKKPKLE